MMMQRTALENPDTDADPTGGTGSKLHSRSILAGYRPEVLFGATVLVVGAGALGQNVLLDLGLGGVGELWVVDFDDSEPHNATRSPLYPSPAEQRLWGLSKATVVAHKLLRLMTAPRPAVRYAHAPVQALGDLVITAADLVISCVDNPDGRAYLQERCRLHRKPLIEAGFHGHQVSLALYGPDPEEPCYRCANPARRGAFSCTRYAREAIQLGVVPALQNGAAVLAGLQTECGIQWLHGEAPLRGRRLGLNIRTGEASVTTLGRDARCRGVHWATDGPMETLDVEADGPLGELLDRVRERYGPCEVCLPSDLMLRVPCTECLALTEACCPEWQWLMTPRCTGCGGPFERARADQGPASYSRLSVHTEDGLTQLACRAAGLVAGGSFELWGADGSRRLLRLPGSLDDLLIRLASIESVKRSAEGQAQAAGIQASDYTQVGIATSDRQVREPGCEATDG